ncbi:ran GTPase-activating protein [Phlebotomus papatasi]|uniref:ran GTPase-activating protein n=1 Tax=Phlebotomus papatasi TaxID=29031 RepID=UPI002483E475|nr:ran GTPase-activating protein [Phlebotomus papatasi]
MAEINLNSLSAALDNVSGSGVSFEDKTKNWGTKDEVKELTDAIDKCQKLEYLNLAGNTLGVEAAQEVGKALKKHSEFQRALWKDSFTGRLKTEIPIALAAMGRGIIDAGAHLTVFDCSDNALGPNGMKGLVELFSSAACFSLQELKLNNCGLGIDGGKMLAKALTECHKASVKANSPLRLKVFVAGRNRLENKGAEALAGFFAQVKSLEEITMPQNGIYHEGITALSAALRENTRMQVLNLNDNTIGLKGADALADAISNMQQLREINFGDCLLKTRGATLLSEVLSDEHEALEILNLTNNEIGPNGGLSLASAMANKINLQSLLLDGNQFGQECREMIMEELRLFNLEHTLGSLEEDDSEGEEEYDEGEDEMEEEEIDTEDLEYIEDDDECAEDDEETDDAVEDAEQEIMPNRNVLRSEVTPVEAFCRAEQPTLAMFEEIDAKDRTAAFRNYLNGLPGEFYLVYLVFAILKCSALSLQSKEALAVSDDLFADALKYAQDKSQVNSVRNFFLIQLCLLRCEDKSFKPTYDPKACRSALESAMQRDFFPSDLRGTFQCFLDQFKLD